MSSEICEEYLKSFKTNLDCSLIILFAVLYVTVLFQVSPYQNAKNKTQVFFRERPVIFAYLF